jgi:hypothetical protein
MSTTCSTNGNNVLQWALLAAAPVGVSATAWYLGNAHLAWQIGAGICGVVLFFGFAVTLKGELRTFTRGDWLITGYVFLLMAAWIGGGLFITRAKVYIDNFSDQNATLELNGAPWRTIDHGNTDQTQLATGTYELVVRSKEKGEELDHRTITVEDKGPYLLNVLGAQTYARGSTDYGFSFSRGGSPDKKLNDVWIKANVDYLFKEPPQAVQVSEDTSYASRSYLLRTRPDLAPKSEAKEPTKPKLLDKKAPGGK